MQSLWSVIQRLSKTLLYFYNDLKMFGRGMVKSEPAVEDIIADIFLKVWTLETDLMAIDQINTYLYKSVRNNAIKYLERLPQQVDISEIINFEYHMLTPEQALISQEHLALIESAIAHLPSKCRMAFTLVKDLDCSYKTLQRLWRSVSILLTAICNLH
ncbi:hypothetical protein OKW96_04035 [Sphingobacterium sp. KU25419]|nr:hypothetical protein OKW96_04035 [Sphingobacterium sp. KU25419]